MEPNTRRLLSELDRFLEPESFFIPNRLPAQLYGTEVSCVSYEVDSFLEPEQKFANVIS